MRVFKYLFFALLFLIIAFYAYGFFFLEDKVQVSRTITIDRPAKMVFKAANSMHTFNEWSPWAKLEPDTKFQFEGPEKGVGSKMTWQGGESVGSGTQEIIESIPYEKVKSEMHFSGQGGEPSWTTIKIDDSADKSTVSWIFEVDFKGSVINRFKGLMLDKLLGKDFEKGLQNLKDFVEAKPVYDFSGFSVEDVEAQNVLYVSAAGNTSEDLSAVLAAAYGQLTQFMTANGIDFAGQPIAITRSWDESMWEFDAAIPVSIDAIEGETGDIQLGKTYEGKAVKYVQMGSYDQAEASYALLDAYMQEHELEQNGMPWEVYVSDPATVAESDIITHIFQPIK